jgi:hypothetical protein
VQGVRQHLGAGQQVMLLNAGALAGAVGKHFDGFQAALHLAPPDAVVGLLEMRSPGADSNRKQDEASRGYGQQSRLQAVEEARFHGGSFYIADSLLLHVSCHAREMRHCSATNCNRLRIREIGTRGSANVNRDFMSGFL